MKANGVKAWLLTVLTTVALGLSGWALSTSVDHSQRLSTVEAQMVTLEKWLGRIEGKLDRALEKWQGMP